MVVRAGSSREGGGMIANGRGFLSGVQKYYKVKSWWWLYNTVNILKKKKLKSLLNGKFFSVFKITTIKNPCPEVIKAMKPRSEAVRTDPEQISQTLLLTLWIVYLWEIGESFGWCVCEREADYLDIKTVHPRNS